jgi:hypothetical protein
MTLRLNTDPIGAPDRLGRTRGAAKVREDHRAPGREPMRLRGVDPGVADASHLGLDAEGDPRTPSMLRHSPATRLQLHMSPELASIIFAIGLSIGFAVGYGVRAFISYRRHQAARRWRQGERP